MKIKTKINKSGLIKLKIFCTAKETISKMKRQLLEWKKIFVDEVTKKGLISKILSSCSSINKTKNKNKNTKDPIKTWAKDLNRYFSKEGIHMI